MNRIKEVLEEKHLTQTWLSKELGKSYNMVNSYAQNRRQPTLELAKKPQICLEYIIAHELVHLLERNHNDRFVSLMNKFMPKWRMYRDELNKLPVAHSEWNY